MSTEHIVEINNIKLAASEAVPQSNLATVLANKQDDLGIDVSGGDVTKFLNEKGVFTSTPGSLDRWGDNSGYFIANLSSTMSGKLASIKFSSAYDNNAAIYGKIWLNSGTGTDDLQADFVIFKSTSTNSQCTGNFNTTNINNVKLGFTISGNTVNIYGCLTTYSGIGIKLQIERIVNREGVDLDAVVTYYKDTEKGPGEITNITYLNNNPKQIVNEYPDANGIMVQHGVPNKDVCVNCKRTDTGAEVSLQVGSGGINHGLWSTTLDKWMVYGDGDRVYLNGGAFGYNVDTYNNSTTRVELGWGQVDTTSRENNMGALVSFYSVSGPGSTARSITIFVSLSCRGTVRNVTGRIMNNNEWSADNRPVILTELSDSDSRLHIYVGIADSTNTLQTFNWTRTRVFPISNTTNWTWILGHDSTTTYGSIYKCTDTAEALVDSNKKTLEFKYNPTDLTSGSPAADCKSHWSNLTATGEWVYNNRGDEYCLLFNKAGNYGSIFRWSYLKPYPEMLRCYNSNWRTTDAQGWESICPPSVLCFEYTTDTSKMATLATDLDNALRGYSIGGSSTTTRKPIIFLHRDGEYYMIYTFGRSTAPSGGSGAWIFRRMSIARTSTTDGTVALSLNDTWTSDNTHTYSWSETHRSLYTGDLKILGNKTTYYASEGNQTITIDANHNYEIEMDGSATFTLDTTSYTTIRTQLTVVHETSNPCSIVYLKWRTLTGKMFIMEINDNSSGSSEKHTTTVEIEIRYASYTAQGGGTVSYAIASVRPLPYAYIDMGYDSAYVYNKDCWNGWAGRF